MLREKIPVHVEGVIVISKEFEPWYEAVRHQRSTMYWDHYEKYLAQEKKWPAASITTIDQSTDAVVERLTDPTRSDIKRTKGLVVGYVQSGKTANFTGVIAKAIDAGYRLVIVMTGTIEILRAQTQRRIDMELMGVENVLAGQDPNDPEVAKGLDYQQDEDWLADKFVRHSQEALDQPGVARIRRVTTHKGDYKSLPQGMSQLRYERHDKTKPLNAEENLFHTDAYVVIVKKNSAPLKKLIKDLKPMQDMLKELPALIIDDESDVASVNTKDPKKSKDRTKINELITEILEIVPRAQYVGYTATPFANVFIDPDETDKVDLFPSDFVLSLAAAAGVHGRAGVPRHRPGLGEHPQDRREPRTSSPMSARCPVTPTSTLASTRTSCESPSTRGCSAVPSRSTARRRPATPSGTTPCWSTRTSATPRTSTPRPSSADCGTPASSPPEKASAGCGSSSTMTTRLSWPRVPTAQPVPTSFNELKPYIPEAIAEMTSGGADPVLIVNSDKEAQAQQEALDFDKGRVWRILVGGTKLSRGFTVEGLTISYFRRKAGQADTLMQAGRWFGFREGYRDLVRLYIRRDHKVDLYEAFEALLLDEEAFRDELGKYAGLDEDGKPIVEPRQIPPLVSQHLPWLKPTARNKMFNAVVKARASVGAFHQLSSIPPRPSGGPRKTGGSTQAQHKANLDEGRAPASHAGGQGGSPPVRRLRRHDQTAARAGRPDRRGRVPRPCSTSSLAPGLSRA